MKKLLRWVGRIPVRILRLLPISSEIIGPPKGYYRSSHTWINASQTTREPGWSHEIYPKRNIRVVEPKTVDSEIHWRFKVNPQFESPPAYLFTIPKGRLWQFNTVISPNDRLLADLSHEYKVDEHPKYHPVFGEWKLPKIQECDKTLAVLSVAGGGTFAHWLLDLLPRLDLILRKYDFDQIDQFVVNGVDLPFQKQTLDLLGIPSHKLLVSDRNFHLKATQLIVPSLSRHVVGLTRWMPSWGCDFLRQSFLTNAKLAQHRNGDGNFDRIYISRAKATRRKVVNEADVLHLLTKLGFRSVALESLSIAEQIDLFASAKSIVAPHGAGLANLVFSSPGTKVVEFIAPNYVNVNFWALSNQANLDYHYLLGEGERPEGNDYRHSYSDNITVNLDQLANTLDLAGIS
ncbi:glycosyltransferase family 61 protein [Oculatella sp. LEGE 06141]|uniref:glycosyltransferase family 61 protein n=1 Tax=Oculatella sp. LEGE 06141 TaxID=1828648 RepID=UPI00187F037D|nr:glycosyltransferase family 61 protein [Oculatella sp. LEGE 06141]MBE9178831.1 glycosyltransferase family 61 protein [Oculatella sp. LEGE 06141]